MTKKIKNRPFNVPIYDRIHRSLVLKLASKSLQALKFSNSLTFPEFWIKCRNSLTFPWFFSQISNSLTFPGSPGLLGCLPTLIRHYLSLRHDQIWNCTFCKTAKTLLFCKFLCTLAKVLLYFWKHNTNMNM